MTGRLDPLVPRPIDRWTEVPLDPGADLAPLDEAKILAGPAERGDRPAWRAALERWRREARARRGDGAVYADPRIAWASQCRVIAQIWLWDELLYDMGAGRFTPERLLADAETRFGGFDGVVLWHAYPVIGIDDRNQWDYYRQVPGLRDLVDTLHGAGLRVFVDYNPWDTGTRRAGSDAEELARLVEELDADGVFLDTLKQADRELVDAVAAARPGTALLTESKLPLDDVGTHVQSWAQWFADSPVPGVLRTRWFEPRHQQLHIRRWNRDHSDELRSAWLNGAGIMVWENVFSAWVGWNGRDSATLRRMRAVQRNLPDVLADRPFPLADLGPDADRLGVHASVFVGGGHELIAMASSAKIDVRIPAMAIELAMADAGLSDHHGAEALVCMATGLPVAEHGVMVPAGSIGGALRGRRSADVARLAATAGRPVPSDSAGTSFPYRETLRTPAPPSPRPGAEGGAAMAGARASIDAADGIVIPAGRHRLTARFRCRETGLYGDAPFVDEWKPLPPRLHDLRTLEREARLARPVRVALREVSVAEFARFSAATGHDPSAGRPAPGTPGSDAEHACVVGVDLDDARAYCAWAGVRLPTEDEWQLAAELAGPETWSGARARVWNWTESEHTDGRSRFCILKGGSDHLSEGSDWYVDGGPQEPAFSHKHLIQGFHLDRSDVVSFRIASDLGPTEGTSHECTG